MLKYLNPGFALGFLVATIFGAAVLGWQSSYAPTEIEKQECREAAKKSGHKTEECKSLWEKTTSDPVAFFTFVLSVSTIGLWVATGIGIRNQSRETRILQRAYITARRRGIEILEDGNIIGNLAFVNVGNLPARKFRAAVNICWSNNGNLSEFEELPLEQAVILPAKTSFPKRNSRSSLRVVSCFKTSSLDP